MSMDGKDLLLAIKELRKEKAEGYKYWSTTKKKIRDSERAMTMATYARQLEALDKIITILLREQAG